MDGGIIVRNIKAYVMLRKKFFQYIKGIKNQPEGLRAYQLFWDYLHVRRTQPKSRVTISEYFIFGFYDLSKEQRLSYMTDYEAAMYMRPYTEEAKPYLWDKAMFLKSFSPYINREWKYVRELRYSEFSSFAERHQMLAVKPLTSSWGIGFERFEMDSTEDLEQEYNRFYKKDVLMEEYLISDKSLSMFHPPSLNTVRIITFYNGEKFKVFGAGLRVGNHGRHIDNAHGGGIFCEINPDSGKIITAGLDEWGNEYECHPVTGIYFRDFQIPKWEEMVELCKKASKSLPFLRIVGWDVALLQDGMLELIEGNHNPGMNIVQAPAKRGQKERFINLIQDYFGCGFTQG